MYRTPKPKVFSKARRTGNKFKVDMTMTHPLRQKKVSDDDYAAILTTYSALGALSDFELSNDRTRLSAVYTPDINESSFTLLLRGYGSVTDPDSLEAEDTEFELLSVATFYAGIDGMHRTRWATSGRQPAHRGDRGRVTLPSGAFTRTFPRAFISRSTSRLSP